MAEIVDRWGQPIRRQVLTEERAGPTVSGVRSIWSNYHVRDLTPAKLAAILRASETPGDGATEDFVELAEVMEERDLHYLGTLQTRRRQVAQIGITIEPASDSAEDVRDADLVREFFERDGCEDELVDLLDAIGKGYSVAEILWETSERQWMPQRLEWRLPRWFDFDRVSGQRLMRRGDDGAWVDLEPWKFVVHTARAKSGLPIRGGLARIAAWAWMFKSYSLRDWVRFVEAYGQPLRLGKYDKSSTPDDRAVLYRAVRNIGADACAIVPEEMAIDFVTDSTVRGRSEIYRDLVGYIDSQVSIAVLGQTLTTQPGESGSYSLGQVHNMVRQDIERSDGRQLAGTLRRDLVIPMVTLNHGQRKAYPKVVIERVSEPNLDMLSQSLERLVPLGLRVRQDQIRTWYGLDKPDAEDEVLAAPSAGGETPGATDPPEPPPAGARDAGGDDPRASAATGDEDDPVAALLERARAVLGPLIDGWAEEAGREIAAADSLAGAATRLDALLAWTESSKVPPPDVSAVTDALGSALVAAHLAGRFDIEVGPVDLAQGSTLALLTAATEHTQLPFAEQIDFFRNKVDLPSQSWTDLWQEEHDRAFVVAGAAHVDLVKDLRAAVQRGIEEGTTLATFRGDFDQIVAKHGWSHKGGRAWRTEVIYATNLRTSYAAGRYRQMQDVVDRRPFWRYRHSHASEHPREKHLAWDGLVLRHDDSWWDTHYPPNGWGCQCFVEALSERDLKRLGKSGPDTAPPIETHVVTVGEKGPNPRVVTVPIGIDPGWGYAPGKSVVSNNLPGGGPPADPWAIGELTRGQATAQQLGGQGGSNPGGLYKGEDGVLRYVKFYDDVGQAYGEAVANRAYRELGLDAPVSSLVRDGDRIVGIANEIIDHQGIIGDKLGPRGQNWQPHQGSRSPPKGRSQEVLKGYAADVWLMNWDVLGRDMDNIVKTGKARNSVARIDQGGALLMRGLQGRKPRGALGAITEWGGFASPGRNPSYAAVVRAAGYESADELGRAALGQIKAIQDLGKRSNGFRDLAPSVAGVSEEDIASVRRVLKRRAKLLQEEIVPRLRGAKKRTPDPAHQVRTKAALGQWYNRALEGGKRKVAGGAPRRGLTDPELASVYSYTTESGGWARYANVNKLARDAEKPGGAPLPRRVSDFMLTLNDALDKLPDEAGTFYRGVTLDASETARYVVGRSVPWKGFSSSSRYKRSSFGGNVRFVIRGRHGKDIRPYSSIQSENEVLFRAGTNVRVLDVKRERGRTTIEVEEV